MAFIAYLAQDTAAAKKFLNGSLKKQEFPVLLDVLLRGLHIWV